tara:strand:- start:3048 stop:3659 length:612 start_codon:yes stop_codon:yes gene_type:complete
MTPEVALQTFQAIKMHFTTDSYDYFKYNGKIRTGDLEAKKDKWNYVKLARNHGDHLVNFLVANFVSRDNIKWSGDVVGSEAERTYQEWQKRTEAMSYIFTQELQKVFSEVIERKTKIKSLFESIDSEPPLLLTFYQWGTISLETLIILGDLLEFFGEWDKQEDEYIWPDIKTKINNYRPFLIFDERKYQKIISEEVVKYMQNV